MAQTREPGDFLVIESGSPFVTGSYCLLITATTSGGAHTLYTATATTTSHVDFLEVQVWNNDTVRRTVTFEVDGVDVGPISVGANSFPATVFEKLALYNAKTLKVYAEVTSMLGVKILPRRALDRLTN